MNWKDTYELSGFSIPDVVDFPNVKKQFKIHVDCNDTATNTAFGKTVFFGSPDDFVWSKDKTQRLKKLNSLTNKDNPLHSDYWRAQLCFFSDDFKANVNRMVNYLLDKRVKRLASLKPKKDFTPIVAKRGPTHYIRKR